MSNRWPDEWAEKPAIMQNGWTGHEFPFDNGWGMTVFPGTDLAWIYLWRDVPGQGRITFPIIACAVVPADCGEGRPAFEIQHDDPFVAVFADDTKDGSGYIEVYVDRSIRIEESMFNYPGTTDETEEE